MKSDSNQLVVGVPGAATGQDGKARAPAWRLVCNAPFLVAAVVLLVGAIGLRSVIQTFELFMTKEAIPLRRQLADIPARFGPYILKNTEPDLTPDIEAVLGAQAYITREYRDSRLEEEDPGALMRLHIAYFTGTPDLVLHVPEVCYVAGGAQEMDIDHVDVPLEGTAYFADEKGDFRAHDVSGDTVLVPQETVPLRVFDFVPRGGNDVCTVSYFFMANGKVMGSPERVRTLAFDIRDRYAYWCKIEVLPLGITDREKAMGAVAEFLRSALPEVLVCLPDWQDVRAGRYPRAGAADRMGMEE